MNVVHISGNLTADPEVRSVGETQVVNFRLANNRRIKRKGNDKATNEVTFIDCEAWDSGAEVISQHFKKGDPIILHGALRLDAWKDKEGNDRSRIKLRVSEFEFPIRARADSASRGKPEDADSQRDQQPADADGGDKIPF
jgi:single-strand DNA-binding protein